MESTFEDRGGPIIPSRGGRTPYSGYKKPSSTGRESTSGRYHGGSSNKFSGSITKPVYGYTGHKKPAAKEPSKSYSSKGTSGAGYSKVSSGYKGGGYHSSSSSKGKKGVPAYISKSGAVFDAYFNHIPTDKVPVFIKGPGWSAGNLISYGDRNPYGDYSDNVFDSAYDEFMITGGSSGSSYKPDLSFDLNPYKEMLKEMQKLRLENLELGKKALSDEAGEHYRQAYINHQKSMNGLSEKLFNAGSTGGITESTAAYMDSAYKNAISDIEKEKLKNIGRLQSQYAEGSSKDQSYTFDSIMKQMEKMRSERNAYERMLEERRYREKKEERDFRRKLLEKYYGF